MSEKQDLYKARSKGIQCKRPGDDELCQYIEVFATGLDVYRLCHNLEGPKCKWADEVAK